MSRFLLIIDGDVIGTVYAMTPQSARRKAGRVIRLGTHGLTLIEG